MTFPIWTAATAASSHSGAIALRGFDHSRRLACVCQLVGQLLLLIPILLQLLLLVVNYFVVRLAMRGLNPQTPPLLVPLQAKNPFNLPFG